MKNFLVKHIHGVWSVEELSLKGLLNYYLMPREITGGYEVIILDNLESRALAEAQTCIREYIKTKTQKPFVIFQDTCRVERHRDKYDRVTYSLDYVTNIGESFLTEQEAYEFLFKTQRDSVGGIYRVIEQYEI